MESIGTPNDRDPHSKASYGSKADSETIGDSETAIQKLRFRNYFHRFRNYCDSETNAIQKLRFRNYRDSETIAIPKLSRFQNYRDSATITIQQLRFRNYREVLVSESARDPSYGRLWNGFSSSGVPSSTKKWAIIMVVGVISPTYGGYYMFLPYIPISQLINQSINHTTMGLNIILTNSSGFAVAIAIDDPSSTGGESPPIAHGPGSKSTMVQRHPDGRVQGAMFQPSSSTRGGVPFIFGSSFNMSCWTSLLGD